jgi:hypothetical protein
VYETRDAAATWHRTSRDPLVGDVQDVQDDPHDFGTLYLCRRASYDRTARPPVVLPGGSSAAPTAARRGR